MKRRKSYFERLQRSILRDAVRAMADDRISQDDFETLDEQVTEAVNTSQLENLIYNRFWDLDLSLPWYVEQEAGFVSARFSV